MSEPRHSLADATDAQAALTDLVRPFAHHGMMADVQAVDPRAVPQPWRGLLVHNNHMTVELESHYGKPVEVRVLDERLAGDCYTRKIALALSGTERIVEWGVARIDLRFVSAQVRAEVLARQSPLGAILIRHNVHRRVEPRHYVRFTPPSAVVALFSAGYGGGPAYGRLGTIYCDDEPAIDLLEIVVDTEERRQ